MFTGIIQQTGRIQRAELLASGMQLAIAASCQDYTAGESIAVNGCCLTVAEIDAASTVWHAHLSAETLSLTHFKSLRVGDVVNLERSLTLASLLGGHLVSGHLDGQAQVVAFAPQGDDRRLVVKILNTALLKFICKKGSIALNGVSLTVNEVRHDTCQLNLVPHTLASTNLGALKVGALLNLEVDMLARYLHRLYDAQQAEDCHNVIAT